LPPILSLPGGGTRERNSFLALGCVRAATLSLVVFSTHIAWALGPLDRDRDIRPNFAADGITSADIYRSFD
jgi:hypothetical protein